MLASRFRIAACALLVASRVHAEDVRPVELDFRAHAGCPDEQDFLRELTARTHLARRAQAGDDALPVRVRIEEVPGGSRGQLVLGQDSGATKREVSAAHCEQVVAALALMTALAIDPDAIASAELPAAKPPEPAPPPPHEPAPPPAPPLPPAAPSLRTRWSAGVSLELLDSVSPDPQPSIRPFLGLDRERSRAFGYGIRLSAARAHGRVARADGAGEFGLSSGRLEACPLHVPAWDALWFSACAAFEAGQLRATGSDVSPARSLSRPWLAPGATGRLELRPLGPLSLEIAGVVLFPLLRDRFYIQADSTVRRTPALVGGGSIGISVRFP